MEGGIVEEDNGAGLHLGHHPLGDVGGGQILPVQTVTIPNNFKALQGLPLAGSPYSMEAC